MADLSQESRTGKLETSLGDTELVLARFSGSESLSELFEFRIEAVSEQANIDFNSALGTSTTVQLKAVDGSIRYFNGLLAEARWAGQREAELYAYQLVIRPSVWLLSLKSNCRIFSNLSVVDILKQVLTGVDCKYQLKSSYAKIEYCVQYHETDLDFISRMMEQWGIYYFFEHSDGNNTLVLADQKSSHEPVPGLASVPFRPVSHQTGAELTQHLEDWLRGRSVESGSFVLKDYDYRQPGANMLATSTKPGGYANDSQEMFRYLGEYEAGGPMQQFADVEAQAAQSLDDRRTGTGPAVCLFPGGLVTLTDHPESSENEEYIVVGCSHFYDGQQYRSGGAQRHGSHYQGNFEFTPSSKQFRAELDTERPRIAGVQSALVVGKSGEEIDVDELGRITVQFYWDRKNTASRRVRVAQIWAGSHRGALFTPRIGDEVLIQYEDGDPDRPIVVGSVYNGTNKVPADLPAKKTHSGILTKSSKNSSGYNMLLFDDTANAERIKLRAQKDLMFKALNNEQRDILGNQTENIGGDETITVGSTTIGATNISGNFTLNALQTAKINVGPVEMPTTQILMDTQSITLNVGPSGLACQIIMNMEGITLNVGPGGLFAQIMMGPTGVMISGTPMSQLMVQPMGISTMTPMMNLAAMGPITFASPMVTIPLVTIGAGTASGLPII
jgi:type VI secretion system secreted protein VgrG